MAASKKRRGPHSQKSQKQKRAHSRTRGKATALPSQTNEPFEQDAKRRIGQHMGTGRAPLMKK
jgi:hypothetical protein